MSRRPWPLFHMTVRERDNASQRVLVSVRAIVWSEAEREAKALVQGLINNPEVRIEQIEAGS